MRRPSLTLSVGVVIRQSARAIDFCDQRADRAIEVDMIDYATGLADTAFRFALKPDGTPAP
jgi:hypothetical protein